MKNLILLALVFIMCSCVPTNEDGSVKLNTGFIFESHIVIIDSCEYISYNGGQGIAHKGNCKYCAERRKKELENY